MKRKFITNLVLIILLNLLIKPLWIFGIDRHVQNMFPDQFGWYSALFNFSFILSILFDLGLTNYNNRHISQNHHLLQKYFSSIVVLKLIMALLYGLVAFGIAIALGYTQQLNLIFFLVLSQILVSFTLYLRSNVAGMQMHTANSIISVLDRALMIGFCAILIWGRIRGFTFSLAWFVYAQTAAYFLTAVICFLIVARKSKFTKLHYDHKFFIVVIRQSWPYALLALLMVAYTRVDVIMLDKMFPSPHGTIEAGIYYNGFRLFDATYQFALLFAVLLLPMFSKMLKEKQDVHGLTLLSSLLLFIPTIALAIGSQVYRTEIMDLLYDHNVRESSAFFGILMFSFLGMAGTIIYGTLLTANGNLKALNITSAIALVINILLNIILIPRYEACGAAISCLTTQVFAGFSQYVITAVKFKFRLNYGLIFRLIIYISGVILLGIGSYRLELVWWISFLGMLTASMIFAMLLNLIDLKAMVRLIFSSEP
ncbi:MAG: oligosaccharide flippase family protein [Bacteroidia bacterium]|nr:oligosaccharide flippase family protein [Bacteroidia bacterium]